MAHKSKRSCQCIALASALAGNIIYHIALLILVRLSRGRSGGGYFIEFSDWYFAAACYAPPIVTAAVVMFAYCLLGCRGMALSAALLAAIGLSVLHYLLIRQMIATV